jgi:DNA-binding GntR family transcriptional regulator
MGVNGVADNGGWVRVTNAALYNHEVSDGALRCLLVLRSHCIKKSYCFPGEATLCAELSVSESTLRRRLHELEKHKFISVKRRGLGKTNIYTLLEKFAAASSQEGGMTSRARLLQSSRRRPIRRLLTTLQI